MIFSISFQIKKTFNFLFKNSRTNLKLNNLSNYNDSISNNILPNFYVPETLTHINNKKISIYSLQDNEILEELQHQQIIYLNTKDKKAIDINFICECINHSNIKIKKTALHIIALIYSKP